MFEDGCGMAGDLPSPVLGRSPVSLSVERRMQNSREKPLRVGSWREPRKLRGIMRKVQTVVVILGLAQESGIIPLPNLRLNSLLF